MDVFSRNIQLAEAKHPGILPDLRQCSTIFVFSDYSGKHDLATHESLSFLFADLTNYGKWDARRKTVRAKYLYNGRRMSYKDLGDKYRRKALLPFLEATNTIPGLNVTVLIDKRIKSLFRIEGYLNMENDELSDYGHWNKKVFEKLLRVVHLISFFMAGLSKYGQDLFWFTDEDDIVPNEQRLFELVKIFGTVVNHYLKHDLRHIRIGTAKSDDGSRQIEDLISIPDIVAGAVSDYLTTQLMTGFELQEDLINPIPRGLKKKTKFILDWFSDNSQLLKRMVYVISVKEGTTSLNMTYLRFCGTNDYL